MWSENFPDDVRKKRVSDTSPFVFFLFVFFCFLFLCFLCFVFLGRENEEERKERRKERRERGDIRRKNELDRMIMNEK